MKAYLIARVSTLDQSDALPGQIYRLTSYAERKDFDYELFEILESAYKSERVSFASVIGKISNNEGACAIVFDKIDRYTRNSNSNEVARLNAACRAGLLELHFVSDNLKITKESSAQEHFMLNMGVSNAQYYPDAISDNVKRITSRNGVTVSGVVVHPSVISIRQNQTVKNGSKWTLFINV